MINEQNFYNLVLGSKLPDAVAFKEYVTGTILPTIRKTSKFDVT